MAQTCTSSYTSYSWLLTNMMQGNNSMRDIAYKKSSYMPLQFYKLGKKMPRMSFCLMFMSFLNQDKFAWDLIFYFFGNWTKFNLFILKTITNICWLELKVH